MVAGDNRDQSPISTANPNPVSVQMPRRRPWARREDKVGPEHRDRAAIVYVRQSSRQQVLEHGESTRLQYALADRAVALGWARSRMTVIDEDLGVSAAVADARVGLEETGYRGHDGPCRHRAGHRDVPAGAHRPRLASAVGAVLAGRDAAGRSRRGL